MKRRGRERQWEMKRQGGERGLWMSVRERESEIQRRMRWNCVRAGILMWQDLENAKKNLETSAISYCIDKLHRKTVQLTSKFRVSWARSLRKLQRKDWKEQQARSSVLLWNEFFLQSLLWVWGSTGFQGKPPILIFKTNK